MIIGLVAGILGVMWLITGLWWLHEDDKREHGKWIERGKPRLYCFTEDERKKLKELLK